MLNINIILFYFCEAYNDIKFFQIIYTLLCYIIVAASENRVICDHSGCVPLNARNARGIISSLLFIKC